MNHCNGLNISASKYANLQLYVWTANTHADTLTHTDPLCCLLVTWSTGHLYWLTCITQQDRCTGCHTLSCHYEVISTLSTQTWVTVLCT